MTPNTFSKLKRRTRALSIVEILVVIGVVTLLIGLLAPALSSVAAGGRSAKCQGHLRQMAIAAHNYSVMFDMYPPAIRHEVVNGSLRNIAWDWVTIAPNQVVSPGALWLFTNNPDEVMQCPDFHGKSSFGEPFTGYNYNTTFVGGEEQFPHIGWANFRKGVPPHACSRASQCAMFGDGGFKDNANKYMRAPIVQAGGFASVYAGAQAFRHEQSTNIAYIDCHIGSSNRPCQGHNSTAANLDQMGYPRNGFLSDDNSAYDPR